MGTGDRPPGVADGPELVVTDRVLTVPNVLSIIRLLSVPVFVYLLLVPQADGWALALLMLSGFTDWADGKLARLLNQTSRLGSLLDPLVDRLYVISTLLGFAVRGIIPWWVAAILIGRDLILALVLPVYRRRGLPPPSVLYLGKAATFALMFALPLVLAAQGDWGIAPIARAWGYALLVWGTGLYVWTGLLYLLAARNVARTVPIGRPRPGPHAR
ncbi:CDP-alcohol phosphatidyltransferase family protein [Rhodococcus kronopolitis]|uniref:CDP-alcohol phosphatidyltransferase family protein n=1 Tax=Rhodococcus kronopolitis TaxID=1460226 RepID=A0ABV9FVT1_9NOCA